MMQRPPPSSAAHGTLAHDQLQVMRWQERTTYRTRDYLYLMMMEDGIRGEGSDEHPLTTTPSCHYPSQPVPTGGGGQPAAAISKQWREIICEWAYKRKLPKASPEVDTAHHHPYYVC